MTQYQVAYRNTTTDEIRLVPTEAEGFGHALLIRRADAPEGWVVDRNETVCPEGTRFRVEFRLGNEGHARFLVSSRVVEARTCNEAAAMVPGATYFNGEPNVGLAD